ncbi:MAG: DUF4397 domain-containing protein [Anaerolineae bacterium]|nr:DUF4397 domain-containing protein [Anaerolineae bacterium]
MTPALQSTLHRAAWLLALLLLTLSASAQEAAARLRMGHLALDAGTVDVYLDDTLYLEAVTLTTLSPWRSLPAGTHTMTITAAGVQPDTPLLTPLQFTVADGDWLTLALIGRRASGSLRLHAVREDYTPIPPAETRLSVLHAFYPNPPLTVSVNGTPVLVGLAYPGTQGTNDGLDTVNLVARGRYEIALGLIDGTPVRTIPVSMGAGRHYFIALTGTVDNPLTVVASTPLAVAGTPVAVTPAAAETPVPAPMATTTATTAATTTVTASATPAIVPVLSGGARLRAGHFAPGAPDFDLYLNGAAVLDVLPYPTLSEYVAVAGGTLEVALVIAGEPLNAAVLRQSLTVAPGSLVTLMAIGSLDTGTFRLQVIAENTAPLRPALARVAIFHAVPDAPFINLIANQTLLVDRLAFPGAFAGGGDGFFSVDVLATDYTMQVELNDARTLNLGTIRMGAGRSYFIVVAGTTATAFYVLDAVTLADVLP